jgi:hypothetical protein
MYGDYFLFWFAKGYCEERRREAEKMRLARLATRHKGAPLPVYNRVLVWLGRRLVVWGEGLQRRFDTAVGMSTLPTPH